MCLVGRDSFLVNLDVLISLVFDLEFSETLDNELLVGESDLGLVGSHFG